MKKPTLFIFSAVALLSTSVSAQFDTTFTCQGELQENGTAADGSFNFDFSLWDAASGGSQIGSTVMQDGVTVTDGRFSVELDFGAGALDNSARWLDIEVNGVTLSPRTLLTRAPYSIQTRGIFVDDSHKVGIGTTSPASELEVANPDTGGGAAIGVTADGTGGALAAYSSLFPFTHLADRVSVFTDAFDAAGLDLRADGPTSDIRFYTGGFAQANERLRITDTGDVGVGTTTPVEQMHVSGEGPTLRLEDDDLPGSYSVFRDNGQTQAQLQKFNASGNVIFDIDPIPSDGTGQASLRLFRSTNTTGLKRVLFYQGNNSTATSAAIGIDGADSYFQLQGGNVGIGTSVPDHKLHAVTNTANKAAVFGEALSNGFEKPAGKFVNHGLGAGVDASTDAANARAVDGHHASTNGGGAGVYGRTSSPNGFGVVSEGDFAATGTKSFIQPHPYDASKQIRFVCLEGNEAGTYFRGKSRLENGRAYIEVPEEFRLVTEAEGLTVQLTARGPDAGLWVRSSDLELIVVMGRGDVEFDYFVNGVRRGYANHTAIEQNTAYVPTQSDKPFGTQYPDQIRQILVDNGTLSPDFTPNAQAAAELGWSFRDEKTNSIQR